MAEGVHKTANGEIWYFPPNSKQGFKVHRSRPVRFPRWRLELSYLRDVVIEVTDEAMMIELLKLPRLWK